MKTQIITLESHDDLISIRDRMSWAKTPRILLVLPKYEKIALRQVDLKVLQRHAMSLGAQLGLVTRRRAVRADAEELGIPVFESTGQAQRIVWIEIKPERLERKAPDKTLREQREQVQAREGAWRAHPITRVIAFLIGVFSVLVLVALFIPRAQVHLKPITQTQSIVVPVMANPSLNTVFITGGIPAYEKRIVVGGEQKILVTGEGVSPQSKAKGVVIFRNLTQNEVTIPAGTVVRSGDVRFVTTENGKVNAGVGKTIELPIEAEQGGVAGNLDAETINVVDGRLGLSLSVTNPEPTKGGRERASVQATDADRTRVHELLLKSLEDEARISLLDELNAGDVLFEDTFAFSQTLLENYDLPSGAAGSQLTLTMQAEFSVQYASASDLKELASLALNASLPSGFIPALGEIKVQPTSAPVLGDDGFARWTIRAERIIVQQMNISQIQQWIAGRTIGEAQTLLEHNLPLLSKPQVSLSPSWWQWVPIVPFRIDVVRQ